MSLTMLFSLSPFSFFKKRNQLFFTAACSAFLSLSSLTAMAQVNVNHSALNNLGNGHPKKSKETHKDTKKTKHSNKKKQQKEQPKTKEKNNDKADVNANKTKPTAPSPTIPPAPPPAPVFKDADIVVPLHPPAPPPMPKVVDQAKGEVRATDKHTLLIFDPNSIDLNQSMMKAIMDYANTLKQHPQATVLLNAYSHGNADDLSTPRRTALNRGLAIRAVLINQGIPSTRIYLLAKGIPDKPTENLSPDHVEMIRSDLADKPQKASSTQK